LEEQHKNLGALATGDFDGDGRMDDFAFADGGQFTVGRFSVEPVAGAVPERVLRSLDERTALVPEDTVFIAVADLDQDGRLDFILADVHDQGGLTVVLNKDDGSTGSGFAP